MLKNYHDLKFIIVKNYCNFRLASEPLKYKKAPPSLYFGLLEEAKPPKTRLASEPLDSGALSAESGKTPKSLDDSWNVSDKIITDYLNLKAI